MRQQLPSKQRLSHVRPTPLLMLWVWIGMALGLSQLTLAAQDAQAADLIIPETAAPAAPPAPVRPAPSPVVRADPPAPKPVVRSAPLSRPAPRPIIIESVPKPVVHKPVPVQKAPAFSGNASKSTKPAVVIQAPSAPAAQPNTKPVSRPIAVPTTPRVKAPPRNALIDASPNYDLGATPAQLSNTSPRVVISERRSGCQAIVSKRSIASSICGGGTPPARTVRVRPTRAIATASTPAAISPGLQRAYLATRKTQSGYSPNSRASATSVPQGLSPATAPTFAATPYQQGQSQTKPYTGANPLKWLLSDGKRMIFPLTIPAQITSAFGWRVHPISGQEKFHSGTDIAAPMGTPVVAVYDGQVALADYQGGYGLSIFLHHEEGKIATRYGHLSEIFVQPGQIVEQGTVIGLVGSTGYSTGPHLHFEELKKTSDGYALVDPSLDIKLALSALVEATKLAQQQPSSAIAEASVAAAPIDIPKSVDEL
ncbi:MAG: peptidoglycan DD-metalloendopeptidase family protein [Thermosynechococcaceae cyanobacterium]